MILAQNLTYVRSMADPGFLQRGVDLVGGGMDSRYGYVSKILYVKTKESGPLGGVRRARSLDWPMQKSMRMTEAVLSSLKKNCIYHSYYCGKHCMTMRVIRCVHLKGLSPYKNHIGLKLLIISTIFCTQHYKRSRT